MALEPAEMAPVEETKDPERVLELPMPEDDDSQMQVDQSIEINM